MKYATRVKLVITGTGFNDRQADVREEWKGENVGNLYDELQRRKYLEDEVEGKIERELLYICESCGAEFTDSGKIHGCAACSKEICTMCGYRNPRIGHRLWYCKEHE